MFKEVINKLWSDIFSRISLIVLGLIYLSLLFADIIAPYPKDFSDRTMAYVPPSKIFVVTEDYKLSRPYTYNYVRGFDDENLRITYNLDRSKKHYVKFFAKGQPYKFLGVIPMSFHIIKIVSSRNGQKRTGCFFKNTFWRAGFHDNRFFGVVCAVSDRAFIWRNFGIFRRCRRYAYDAVCGSRYVHTEFLSSHNPCLNSSERNDERPKVYAYRRNPCSNRLGGVCKGCERYSFVSQKSRVRSGGKIYRGVEFAYHYKTHPAPDHEFCNRCNDPLNSFLYPV